MAGRAAVGDTESPVRVVVTPSQSSYFAGEPFSVTITFTNTRTAEAGPSKVSAPTHKRGAHSISSAPLARPPTSPGTPRSALVPSQSQSRAQVEELPRRKGIIGKTRPLLPQGSEPIPDLIEQRRKRQLAQKSLSVSISAFELDSNILHASSAPPSQGSFHDLRTPTSSHISSPLARTDALPLSNDHPHARKQSVLDGQFTLDILSPTTSVPPSPYSPYTPTSSTSTFSLALDPIAESTHSPYPSTPAIGSPTIEPVSFPSSHTPTTTTSNTPPNSVYGYPPPRSASHRPAPIGLGQPSSASRTYPQQLHPRTAFASSFPPHTNTELILYSYAQLTGTVVLTPVPGVPPTPEQARTLGQVRSMLLNRAVLGGGSMDITAMLQSPTSGAVSPRPTGPMRHRQAHSRSSSFGAGLMSMLSPTGLVSGATSPTPSSAGFSRSKWRASSSSYGTPPQTPTSARMLGSGSNPNVAGLANGSPVEDINPDEPLPTFEIQPAMLAVDLTLAPGQSRSYTYTVKLPENLPPTFKGKALKFSYELVVGTCRASPTNGGGAVGANSISRVMKVPIRIYNHVSVGRSLKPYDVLWPVSRRQDVGMPGTEAKVVEQTQEAGKQPVLQLPSSATPSSPLPSDTLSSIRDYAQLLLDSLPPPGDEETASSSGAESAEDAQAARHTNGHVNGHATPSNGRLQQKKRAEDLRRSDAERNDAHHHEDGTLAGCREAVEVLTRNPKKASYDVNKDGVKVAVLTFTKSAYRLGETISGVVELNERTSRARVLKLSAILESHESLPSSLSPPSSARHLRRSHAEFHASFTLNTLRTSFSLDIPSDASPAFQVRVGTPPNPSSPSHSAPPPPTPGGLEWKVRMCLLVGIAAETSSTGALQPGVRFKSLVRDGPRGEWGSSWRATPTSAPLEKPNLKAEARLQQQSQQEQQQGSALLTSPRAWSRYIMASLLYGGLGEDTEREYHDGDILDSEEEEGGGYDGIIPDLAGGVGVGVDYGGGEEGWRDVKLETVECEVPVKVFPGNTAFKALDVVFDV